MNSNNGRVSREKDGFKVVFERIYPHAIEKVWDAITNPEQMKYWFTDIEMKSEAGADMKIIFRDKDKTVSSGKIISIDAPNKFVWTWEGELAEWELEAIGENSTRLKFTYSKMNESYAVNAPAGFHWLLNKLEETLQGAREIHPFGMDENDSEQRKLKLLYAANIFSDYPEVVKSQPVRVEKLYPSSPEKIWKALTSKEEMKQWYFELDDFRAEPGFVFRFPGQGHTGAQYMHRCVVLEVIANRKLQYSWEYEGFEGYSIVTFEIEGNKNETRLILTHHGLESFPAKDDFARSSFNEGWNYIIGTALPGYLDQEK